MKKYWYKIPLHIRKSLLLHLIVTLLGVVDLPNLFHSKPEIVDVPIIVDLKNVKISATTNLPSKLKMVKEKDQTSLDKKLATKHKKKTVKQANKEVAKKQADGKSSDAEDSKIEKVKEKPKGDFLAQEKKKKQTNSDKKKKKKEPKKEKKESKKTPELKKGLKSLLASVGDISKNLEPEKDVEEEVEETTDEVTKEEAEDMQNLGVEGGVGGSYFRELTISERDAIAGRLRECWNVDPGARGIEDMVVEVRAYLNKDATVKKVDILDKSRYKNDPFFRSVAESAKRAVFICAPYSLFAEQYSDKYNLWKTILLNFNPVDGSIK